MSEQQILLDRMYQKWEDANRVAPHQPDHHTGGCVGEWHLPGSTATTHFPPSRDKMTAEANKGQVSECCHSCNKWFVSSYMRRGWFKSEAWPTPPLPFCRECVTVYDYLGQFRRA